MKNFQLTFTLIVLLHFSANAQDYFKKFGKIEMKEIKMTEYQKDKSAEAVVLFDVGNSYFVETGNNFEIIFERITRIKILDEAGIKWSEIEIPFYQEGNIFEKVYEIEAYTYNLENGRMTSAGITPSDIYQEKINNYWNAKKFAMPNVKEGSVIEFRYKINSQYKFNLRDWEFQHRIPTVYSEYTVKLIPFYEYTYIIQGTDRMDIMESYEDKSLPKTFGSPKPYEDNTYYDMVHKFGMKDVPAFNDEEFITSINDYIIKLDFQLSKLHYLNGADIDFLSTWPKMVKELLKDADFGKYVKKSEKLGSKIFKAGFFDGKNEKEKFNLVVSYMKNNFNWNNYNGKYATQAPKKTFDDKIGNSADLNLMLAGLLNYAGIDAHPVIISTRGHGKIKTEYPFIDFFNYVIVLANIDNVNILTDATLPYSLNDRIPPNCINDKGLIVKDDYSWINLQGTIPSKVSTNMVMDIGNQNNTTKIKLSANEYDALNFRMEYGENSDEICETLFNSYDIIDSTVKVQNYKEIENPYIIEFEIEYSPEKINGKTYISPFLNEPLSDNPLKQSKRTYPVDLKYPVIRSYFSSINIPEGYTIDFLPEKETISDDLFDLNYSANVSGNTVQVMFGYFFKKPIYSSKDYTKLKYYFQQIVKKGNEKVVLKEQ